MNQKLLETKKSFLGFGLFFLVMEAAKQLYLFMEVFDREYHIWYLPFQLCSMPIYLCLFCAFCTDDGHLATFRSSAICFLQDYGLLAGIAAIAYPAGFTFTDHPIITVHGYVWHAIMIVLAVVIWRRGYADKTKSGFVKTIPLFLALSFIAFLFNIVFHTFGDCDMFYISPYHPSSQPIFHDIDLLLGRPLGIAIYLASVTFGAFLVHCISKIRFTHTR